MSFPASLLICLIFAGSALAQANLCNLSAADLPPLEGLRLKMGKMDLLEILNLRNLDQAKKSDGENFEPFGLFQSKAFEGTMPLGNANSQQVSFSFELFEDRLSKFSFLVKRLYGNLTEKDFKKSFRETLKIPEKCWNVSSGTPHIFSANATFSDFAITFKTGISSSDFSVFLLGIETQLEANKRIVLTKEALEKEEELKRRIADAEAQISKLSTLDKHALDGQLILPPKVEVNLNSSSTPLIKQEDVPVLLPETCSVKLPDIPEVRGLTLGMAASRVIQRYPDCNTELGLRCFQRAEEIRDGNLRSGIDAITVLFDSDSREVAQFSIIYDDSVKWTSVQEFADTISNSLKLPASKWLPLLEKNKAVNPPTLRIVCSNYLVAVSIIDGIRPNLVLSKTSELLSLEENIRHQKNKRSFKP